MALALSILLVLTSILMILLVLLHKGKGSGLSDLFGGGMSSTYGGSSVVEKNLDRITIVVGGVWFAAVIANQAGRTGPTNEGVQSDMIYDWKVLAGIK